VADVTEATFEALVVERSKQVPVVVDLWAEWCGPCKTLGPMLEEAIARRGGAVELAKVDVDANPAISHMFQVKSIPAVFAIRNGQVVDQFLGALPMADIEAFLDRIAPPASEADLLVATGDEASLRKALETEPGHLEATVALAALLVDSAKPDEALELLGKVPETAEVRHVIAAARLAQQQIDVRTQEVAPLLDDLLERVRTDDDARQEFLDLLESLGPTSPVTAAYRKKLAAKLF